MSRTKHGVDTLKGKHMSFKMIKRAGNSKMRAHSSALCHKTANGVDIEKTMFPTKQKCFDPWRIR